MHFRHQHQKTNTISLILSFTVLLLVLLSSRYVYPEKAYFGLQVFAPSFHLSEDTLELGDQYSYKLDKKGKWKEQRGKNASPPDYAYIRTSETKRFPSWSHSAHLRYNSSTSTCSPTLAFGSTLPVSRIGPGAATP